VITVTLHYLKETKRTCVYENHSGDEQSLPPIQQVYINKAALRQLMVDSTAGIAPGAWPQTVKVQVTL